MTRPIETSRDVALPFATDVALKRRFMVVDEPLAGNIRFDLLLEVFEDAPGRFRTGSPGEREDQNTIS